MNMQDVAKAMMELDEEMLVKPAIVSSGAPDDFVPIVMACYAAEDRLQPNADAAGLQAKRPVLYANINRGLTLKGLKEAFIAMDTGLMKEPAIVAIGPAPFTAFHEIDALGMSDNQGDVAMQRFGPGQPIILYKAEPITGVYGQMLAALDVLSDKPSTDESMKAVLYLLSKLSGTQLRDAIDYIKSV